MMKLIRLILVFVLVLGVTIASSSIVLLQRMPLRAMPSQQGIDASPSSPPQLDLEQLEQAIDRQDFASAIRQVEVGWKRRYEHYYQGQFTTQVLESDQIAQSLNQVGQLTGQRSALIYAIPTPEQLELILVSPQGQISHHRIAVAQTDLLATIQTFRMGIVSVTSRPSDYLPAANQIYQWLIAPLESELQSQQIKTLIFCLGAGLRSLPVAALHDGQHFLIETYSTAIIPAFNLLDRHPAALSGTRVLAMGASEFQQEAPLPAVPIELEAIRAIWLGESWLNQAFTLDNLQKRRSTYPFGIVHLATHADFSPGAVSESYIQFWDGRLQLDRLKEMGLRLPVVQLLVLSACRTALGDPNAELGFAGLAVQSGAKSALASLWAVSDAGTLVLMVDFYQQLKTAPTKTEALRQSQLAMLKGQTHLDSDSIQRAVSASLAESNGAVSLPPDLADFVDTDLSHPYYWAAFEMIGNPW
jgi:CHAT domain-containing protein